MEARGWEAKFWHPFSFSFSGAVDPDRRHSSLRADAWVRLLPLVLATARFPEGFTTWHDEVEIDESVFESYREHVVADMVDLVFGILPAQCLEHLMQMLGSPDWREVETALFGLRSVSRSFRELARVAPAPCLGSGDPARRLAEALARKAQSCLDSGGDRADGGCHPQVIVSFSRALSSYARLVSGGEASSLQPICHFVIGAAALPEANAHASVAFRDLMRTAASTVAAQGRAALLTQGMVSVLGEERELAWSVPWVRNTITSLTSVCVLPRPIDGRPFRPPQQSRISRDATFSPLGRRFWMALGRSAWPRMMPTESSSSVRYAVFFSSA